MPSTESCATCYYFLQSGSKPDGSQIGYCRANPPTAREPDIAKFPIVLGVMWCGAWEPI